jgi:hypothetical protein
MLKKKDFQVGDKVHYIPYKDCPQKLFENGIVKEIPESEHEEIRVVYYCSGDWDRYMIYTSALTPVNKLQKGWIN